jgi:hypothetical protein
MRPTEAHIFIQNRSVYSVRHDVHKQHSDSSAKIKSRRISEESAYWQLVCMIDRCIGGATVVSSSAQDFVSWKDVDDS